GEDEFRRAVARRCSDLVARVSGAYIEGRFGLRTTAKPRTTPVLEGDRLMFDAKAVRWAALGLGAGLLAVGVLADPPVKYPATRKCDQVDDLHGVKVADPYRWLEDLDSKETADWVAAENAATFGYLAEIPEREKIRKRLTDLWDFPRFGVPFKEGGRY